MICPTCTAKLSDTAKFCDHCGTQRPKPAPGLYAKALAITMEETQRLIAGDFHAFFVDGRLNGVGCAHLFQAVGDDILRSIDRACATKDAEIARLKAELDTTRTAAANARREALREADQLASSYLVARRPEIEVFVEKLRELRAASQPAADTQGCSDPGCGQCACQSSRVQPSAETQATCKQCGNAHHSMCDTCKGEEQQPARDVEGLAPKLRGSLVRDREATLRDARDLAETAIAFLDGGPRP